MYFTKSTRTNMNDGKNHGLVGTFVSLPPTLRLYVKERTKSHLCHYQMTVRLLGYDTYDTTRRVSRNLSSFTKLRIPILTFCQNQDSRKCLTKSISLNNPFSNVMKILVDCISLTSLSINFRNVNIGSNLVRTSRDTPTVSDVTRTE